MTTDGYILAIDPDVERSGFALLDCKERSMVYCAALTFAEAIRYFDFLVAGADYRPLRVVIEDSDISTNWHYSTRDRAGVIAAKGRSVGMCHATTRHLREYAEYCGLKVEMQRPLKKCWKGRDGKITQMEIVRFIAGLPTRCNQEQRDAALLAWCFAGLPVRLISR